MSRTKQTAHPNEIREIEKSKKKRKTPEESSGETKFQGTVNTFMRNQENLFLDWLIANGFPEHVPASGASELSAEDRGKFTDEMASLMNSYLYDTIIHVKEGDKGPYVTTTKSGKEPNKCNTFFEEIEQDPAEVISSLPSDSEGPQESHLKKKQRKLHDFTPWDLSRACLLGGAIKASPEAKKLLGDIVTRRRAHIVQLGALAASANKNKTIKAKHIKVAMCSDGVVSV